MVNEVSGAVALQLAAEMRALGRGECAADVARIMDGDGLAVLGLNALTHIITASDRKVAFTLMGLLSAAFELSGQRAELCERVACSLERAAGAVAREAVN